MMVVNETLVEVAACCHLSTSTSIVNGSSDRYFSHVNGSSDESVAEWVLTELVPGFVNDTTLADNSSLLDLNRTDDYDGGVEGYHGYWALILVLFPIFTVFGNVLVILSVYKEKNLQTVTNYFIVSLAVADLLVAALVMPFAVYVLVNGNWELSSTLCDFYIAMDVICSTSSIFNLVAISVDRYIAVIKPLNYGKHKNNKKRGHVTISLVWVISAAIGSPILLGLNTAPDKDPLLCVFYNTDFIIYSSLSSFYIPCIAMVYLYIKIFRRLAERAQAAKVLKKGTYVIENRAQTQKLQETALLTVDERQKQKVQTNVDVVADPPTDNPTESGSQEEEEEEQTKIAARIGPSPEEEKMETALIKVSFVEECQVIPNDKSTEFMLTPVKEESTPDEEVGSGSASVGGDKHCNNDSGYAASTLDETTARSQKTTSTAETPNQQEEKPLLQLDPPTPASVPQPSPPQNIDAARRNGQAAPVVERSPSNTKEKKEKKFGLRKSRFLMHKGSRKKATAAERRYQKEKSATKTLAVVLGVFLICWVPFFTCNIMDALCTKLHTPSCQPSMTTFLLTTWLGYMNSFINPVIYTVFSGEFRKAFKKILSGR